MNKRLYEEAKLLRISGKSYSEISLQLSVPKSTLSTWFSKADWSIDTKMKLNQNRRKMGVKALQAANAARNEKNRRERERFRKEADASFHILIKNRLFLIGLSLYWGEGDKIENGRVAVINTDVELLKIVVRFYLECLGGIRAACV